MLKNTPNQKWRVFAFNRSTQEPVLSDAANITASLRKDYAAGVAVADTNPTEVGDGYYDFDITQSESDADHVSISPVSSTTGVQVLGDPPSLMTVVRVPALEGAFTIDVTIENTSSAAIEGAKVRFARTGQTETKLTDANGLSTFAADAATWTVTISAAGFVPRSETLVVTADAAVTYQLTAASVSPPSDPGLCRLEGYVYLNGAPIEDAVLKATLKTQNSAADGVIFSTVKDSAKTDSDGYAFLELVRRDQITDGDGVYIIQAYHNNKVIWTVESAMPNQANADLDELIVP